MKKRIISIILIISLTLPLLPKEGFATKFTFDINDETVQKLLDEGYAPKNINKKPINPYVYNDYGIVVWGDWSDVTGNEHDYSEDTKKEEYRYLGQDVNGEPVTNDLFPNDSSSSVDIRDKNWQIINSELIGWKLDAIQIKQILYSKPIKNDGTSINYSVADILAKKTTDENKMKEYILVQDAPTDTTEGSVRLKHKTSNGKTWYDTFTIPRLPQDKITIKYINAMNNQPIKTQETKIMKSGENIYEIPEFGGFLFQHWVLDGGGERDTGLIVVPSNSDGTEHVLEIYYILIGDISAILEMTADPDYVKEGQTDDIEITLDASKSSARYKIDSFLFEASLNEDLSNAKIVNTGNNSTTVTFEDIGPNTTIYGRVIVTDDDTGQTATATTEILIGKSAGGGEHNPYDYEVLARFGIDDPILKDRTEDIVFEPKDINFKDNSYNPRVRFNNKDPEFDGVNQWEIKLELGPSLIYTDRFEYSTYETKYKPKIYTKEELNEKISDKIAEFLNTHIDEIVDKGREIIFLKIYETAREVEGYETVLDDEAYDEITIFLTGNPTLTKHYINYDTGEEIKTETKTIPFLNYYFEKYPFKIYPIDNLEYIGWKKDTEQEYWEFSYLEGDYYIGKYKMLGPQDVDVYLYFQKLGSITVECKDKITGELIQTSQIGDLKNGNHMVDIPVINNYVRDYTYEIDGAPYYMGYDETQVQVELTPSNKNRTITFYYSSILDEGSLITEYRDKRTYKEIKSKVIENGLDFKEYTRTAPSTITYQGAVYEVENGITSKTVELTASKPIQTITFFYEIQSEEPKDPLVDLNALISAFPQEVFVGQEIKVSNYSTSNIDYFYQWYINGEGIPKSKSGFSMVENVQCTKTIKLKIWDGKGNQDEAQVTVRWRDVSLDAKVAATPTSAMEGDIINVSNLSTGDYDNWKWTINGETKYWGKDGGQFIAREGNNTISLNIEHEATGKSDSDSVTVLAERPNKPPNALFTVPNFVIRGQTINVDDKSSDSDGTIVKRVWNISGSSKYTSNLKTDGSGGTIVVDEFTKIRVELIVWDDAGDTDTYIDYIDIGGNEEININLKESGTKKVNRKYSIDLSNSTVGEYYCIDWKNTKYTFTPIFGLSKKDIKYKITEKGIDVLSKKEGQFDIKIDMKDTGSRIKTKTIRVNIGPDIPPIINNTVDKTVTYRTESVNFDSEMYSSDGDIIQTQWNKMYYDSDNDGDFAEETGVDISEGNIEFDEVGKYKIVGFAKESFGQETIEEFVTESDRLETTVENVINVANMSPKTEIETDIPPVMDKVDVLVILDEDVDTGNMYKVHDLDNSTSDPTPIRDYIKGSINEFINKFKGKQVDAKLFIKDLKTDKYIKTDTRYRTGDYATDSDNNFSSSYSYSSNGFSGAIPRINVNWTERRVNVTESFTKAVSKNNPTKDSNIFSSEYYIDESRNVASNPATKFTTTTDFSGDIPRTNISWRANYHYDYKNVSETEYKSNLSSKNESSFNSTKAYNSGGYIGTLTRTGVSWTANLATTTKNYTDSITKTNLTSQNSSAFPSSTSVPSTISYNGKTATAVTSSNIPRTGISWTQVTIEPAKSKLVYETRTSTNNSFPSTISYSSDGYIGSLTKNGGVSSTTIVISPEQSKTATDSVTITSEDTPSFPSTLSYNSGGYTGTLRKSGSPVRGSRVGGSQHSENFQGWKWTQNYSGTVTKPEVTQTEYTQKYWGIATKPEVKGYNGTASYSGSVIYQYEESYNGTATYSGSVVKTTFIDYTGTATYSGNLTAYNVLDGYHGTATYRGKVTKLEKENIEPAWGVNTNKYIIYVGDDGVNNQDVLSTYKTKANAGVICISNQELSSADKNITYSNIEENMDEAIGYIAEENPPIAKSAVLINEEKFNIKTENSDPENDNIKIKEIKFFHNPDYYLNSLGVTGLSQDWQDATSFDMNNLTLDKPGEYIISYRVQDEPKEGISFSDYRKYSNVAQVSIFGHRRPIVTDFSINFMYNPSTGKYEDPDFLVDAYDPDNYVPATGQGRTDKGILAYNFRWKVKGQPDSEYQFGLPTSLNAGTYVIEVMARDVDYAWSLPYVEEVILTDTALDLKAQLYPENNIFDLNDPGIPASEELKVTGIETIHAYTVDQIEFALYQGSIRKTPLITYTDPGNVVKKDKSRTIWEDIRNYEVPETLTDGIYTAKIKAIAGAVAAEKTWTVKVSTPINLEPVLPDVLITEEDTEIGAKTSIYANNVTATMFVSSPCEETIVLNNISTDEIKEWNRLYTIPVMPEAQHKVKYVARTPNGNVEEVIVDIDVIDVVLFDFKITRVTDHKFERMFKNNSLEFYAKDLAFDETDHDDELLMKKGYAFYFEVSSRGLANDNDNIRIRPRLYTEDGKKLLMYYETKDNPYVLATPQSYGTRHPDDDFLIYYTKDMNHLIGYHNELILPRSLRTINGSEQTWKGRYGVPATAIFVEKDSGKSPVNPKDRYEGKVLINFDIEALKDGVARYNYVSKGKWEEETTKADGTAKNPTKYNKYDPGDVIVIDGKHSIDDNFEPSITH